MFLVASAYPHRLLFARWQLTKSSRTERRVMLLHHAKALVEAFDGPLAHICQATSCISCVWTTSQIFAVFALNGFLSKVLNVPRSHPWRCGQQRYTLIGWRDTPMAAIRGMQQVPRTNLRTFSQVELYWSGVCEQGFASRRYRLV